MTTRRRAPRPRKPDNIGEPSLVSNVKAQRIQSALWEFDKAITAAERVWGVDRLPYLVSEATRLKWWRAMDALNDAVRADDVERVVSLSANLVRGVTALIDEAKTTAGSEPISGVFERVLSDGRVLRVVSEWPEGSYRRDPAERGTVVVWSMDEVARMVEANSLVNAVKDRFPGATVTRVGESTLPPFDEERGDDVPRL